MRSLTAGERSPFAGVRLRYLDGAGTIPGRGEGGAHMSEPDRPPPPLVVTLALLTVVSGFVDAVSFLGLGHVFTANMTGNVVLIGFAVAGAPGFSVAASLTALGCFLAGAVAGGHLSRRLPLQRNLLLVVMVVEATCLATAAVVAGSVHAIGSGWPRFTAIGLLAARHGDAQRGRPQHRGARHVDVGAHHHVDRAGIRLLAGRRHQPERPARLDDDPLDVRRCAGRRHPRVARRRRPGR